MQRIPPRISALLNQKGGVGKTTSTVNIGAAIASLGRRTLLIDLDPQSHLSLHLGVDGASVGRTVYDALVDDDCPLRDCVVQVRDNLWLLPSTTDLAGAETELASHPDRNRILRARFEAVQDEFDFVLIDCPPSLGVLTLNGLCLADEVIVPMQAQFLAMQGLTKLLETVQLLSQGLNPALKVGGVVLCMHESQTAHSREVVQELSNFFGEHEGSGLPWDGAKVFMPAIRRNIKLAEAPSFGQTIFDYAPWCPGAIDYRALAERFVREWELAHGVADSVAGKPTPAAAAASAAATAAAAAAAAAALVANRFTPETAAAARAAKAAKAARTGASDGASSGSFARVVPSNARMSAMSTPVKTVVAGTESVPAARGAKADASKSAAKAAAKSPVKTDAKASVKTDRKSASQSEPKPAPKPVARSAAKSEASVEARSEARSQAKPSVVEVDVSAEGEPIDPSHPFRAATRARGT